MRVFDMPAEPGEPGIGQTYRLKKALATVHFDPCGKGRIVFLPQKADVCVSGPSALKGCCEVLYEHRLYHLFIADLLECWSYAIRSKRLDPIRPAASIGACA